jgi:uncharacterized protein (DUF1330 family)
VACARASGALTGYIERAQQFYKSPEYQAAKKLREGAASTQFILVERQ